MSDLSWPDVLDALVRGEDLARDTAASAMRAIMTGETTPAQIGGFLLALRAKGETVDEIAGFAAAMREFSVKVRIGGDLVDTCGTGGDRSGTCNISTMAALVAAGAGARVAKHGNRSSSSKCGSADVLEALGVAIELSPEGVAACIDEAGIGFMFAPAFHPAMRHAGPVRRELGVRTVFNFLGPLTNPAGARRQTIGVPDAVIAPKMAEALVRLGTDRAMVFRGDDGLDELSVATTSRVWDVNGDVRESSFDPASVGIARSQPQGLHGGDAARNAEIARALLDGEAGPVREAVSLNAAAALVVAGIATGIADGLARARESIDSGAAARALDRMRDVSQRARA
jgi:anthranilate phosphoribosyltransferase